MEIIFFIAGIITSIVLTLIFLKYNVIKFIEFISYQQLISLQKFKKIFINDPCPISKKK